MRFLVYYIRSPLSTLYFNAPPAPDQHPTPCSHIPPPMPRHSRPYAAYNLSPHTLFRLPMPRLPSKPYPLPLIQPHYPRSLLFIPPHIPLSHILAFPQSFPSLKTLARHSLTHTNPLLFNLHPPPPYIPLSPALSSSPQHNTTQHNSYLCTHEQVRFGKSYPA